MHQELALEIYQLIIAHVDATKNLLSLALSCSAFRDEAQRCLFRHVQAKSHHQYKSFPAAINASPLRLGPLVHTLDFKPHARLNISDFSSALRAMHNLKHLAIGGFNPSTVFRDCVFKLQTLHYVHVLRNSEMLFLLCNFLPTQPSMKRLQLIQSTPFDVAAVPTDLCPNLNSLAVSDNRLIAVLLRDTRLITRFQWHEMGIPSKMTIQQLNHLEYLLLPIYASDIDASFALKLTSLVHLDLQFKLNTPELVPHKVCHHVHCFVDRRTNTN
jgi:hypothetical protein